jgi:hypothetical protein
MSSYRRENLIQLCNKINAKMAGRNWEWSLVIQSRNGYTAVDLYEKDINGNDNCKYPVATGTARECAFDVMQWALNQFMTFT